MKRLVNAFLVVNAAVAAIASADLVETRRYEELTVLSVRQTGNLMPGPGPARKIHSRLEVEVLSTGCTRVEDFKLVVGRPSSNRQTLSIIRTKPDLCEVVSHPKTLEFETTALANANSTPIQILNPLRVETRFVH